MLRIGMMSENAQKFTDLRSALRIIKETGYECADITLYENGNCRKLNHWFYGKDYLNKAEKLKEYARYLELPLVQAHAPFPVYMPDNKRYNKLMQAKLIKCIRICGVLGIHNLVVHPWNNFSDGENILFYEKLLPEAENCGVTICCENMWNWDNENNRAKPCACSLNESFTATVRGVNSRHLKACVDIGHAEMFSYMGLTPRSMIEALGCDVSCLHIHDNDGIHDSHGIPFTGVMDFADVAEGLKNINYKNDLIVETVMDRREENIENAKLFFKEQLEAMRKFRKMITG